MILGAVKRTEPFARLAKPIKQVPVARYTLLARSKPWWTTFAHGFQKRRSGGSWSWAAILSCIVFILAMLGISPISAALLTSRPAQMSSTVDLHRLVLNKTSALIPQVERATYLRTTGAILQNYSTSPWVTDTYFISPIWPPEHDDSMWQYRSSIPQSWEAETTVYRNEFVCSALQIQSRVSQRIPLSETSEALATTVDFVSEDGCQVNLTRKYFVNSMGIEDSAIWTDVRNLNDHQEASNFTVNADCPMNEIILVSTPWWTQPQHNGTSLNSTINAYACRSDHVMAVVPVRASSSQAGLKVDFDETLFREECAPVPSDTFDVPGFRDVYSTAEWQDFIASEEFFIPINPQQLDGAAVLLGTKYSQNISSMINDPGLLETAARMRRYFFAEILRTTLSDPAKSQAEPCSGTQQTERRRVFVNSQVASLLCALLLVSTCGSLALMWFSRLDRRPLNLRLDPTSVLGMISLVTMDTFAMSTFRSLDLSPRAIIKAELVKHLFATSFDRLFEVESRSISMTAGGYTDTYLIL